MGVKMTWFLAWFVHIVYILFGVLYTMYTEYTGWAPAHCSNLCSVCTGGILVCTSRSPDLALYTHARKMYTMYTEFTHNFSLRAGIPSGALAHQPRYIMPSFTEFLKRYHSGKDFHDNYSLPVMKKGGARAPPQIPQSLDFLLQSLDFLCSRQDLSPSLWSFRNQSPKRGRRVQLSTNLDIRPSPGEQPSEMLHSIAPPETMRLGEFYNLADCALGVGSQDILEKRPSQGAVSPRVSSRNELNRCIVWEIRLASPCLDMGVLFRRSRLRCHRRRDRDSRLTHNTNTPLIAWFSFARTKCIVALGTGECKAFWKAIVGFPSTPGYRFLKFFQDFRFLKFFQELKK
jgi:hypothetical protein